MLWYADRADRRSVVLMLCGHAHQRSVLLMLCGHAHFGDPSQLHKPKSNALFAPHAAPAHCNITNGDRPYVSLMPWCIWRIASGQCQRLSGHALNQPCILACTMLQLVHATQRGMSADLHWTSSAAPSIRADDSSTTRRQVCVVLPYWHPLPQIANKYSSHCCS